MLQFVWRCGSNTLCLWTSARARFAAFMAVTVICGLATMFMGHEREHEGGHVHSWALDADTTGPSQASDVARQPPQVNVQVGMDVDANRRPQGEEEPGGMHAARARSPRRSRGDGGGGGSPPLGPRPGNFGTFYVEHVGKCKARGLPGETKAEYVPRVHVCLCRAARFGEPRCRREGAGSRTVSS